MAQLRNDERLFVLLDLARRRPDVLQALAPPHLLEKFEGAESLPEKLQILLAAKGVERAAVFLTSSRPLRRALVQSAFAGDLYNVIERYKRDLFELVPDDADADALSNVLQRFGGGYCAHNRDEERGLGDALAAGQRNAATRAGLRLALALGRRPEVRLDEIESSSLRGLPVRLIRAMARDERRSGPTRKRRAQAAAELAEEKRRKLDAKQAEDAAVARTRNLEREQQVRVVHGVVRRDRAVHAEHAHVALVARRHGAEPHERLHDRDARALHERVEVLGAVGAAAADVQQRAARVADRVEDRLDRARRRRPQAPPLRTMTTASLAARARQSRDSSSRPAALDR